MRSSSDVAFYLLVIAGFLLPFLLLLVFNYSLSVSSITGAFVLCAVFSYAAFWGFSMRNGLAAPLYRRHALWVGAAGAYFAVQWLLLALFAPFYPYGGTPQTRFLIDSYNDFGYTMIFAWIDATMPLVRRSDPFLRNPLRWERLRLILWPLVLLGAVGTDIGLQSVTAITQSEYPALRDLLTTIPYPVLLLGALGLGLSIRRSEDAILRGHSRWFGLAATLIILTFLLGHFAHALGLVPASAAVLVQTLDYVMLTAAGVFLVRSAKDLVPLSQVPLVAVVQPEKLIGE